METTASEETGWIILKYMYIDQRMPKLHHVKRNYKLVSMFRTIRCF